MSVTRQGQFQKLRQNDVKAMFDRPRMEAVPSPPKALGLLKLVTLWFTRRAERQRMERDMAGFTDAVFKDFGLTRAQAEEEVRRPFWRA